MLVQGYHHASILYALSSSHPLWFWSVKPANDVMKNDKSTSSETCESVSAQNLLMFHLRPYAQLELDSASIPSLFTYKKIVKSLYPRPQRMALFSKSIQGTINRFFVVWRMQRGRYGDYILGYRFIPAFKISERKFHIFNLFARGGILLDCGEGPTKKEVWCKWC